MSSVLDFLIDIASSRAVVELLSVKVVYKKDIFENLESAEYTHGCEPWFSIEFFNKLIHIFAFFSQKLHKSIVLYKNNRVLY